MRARAARLRTEEPKSMATDTTMPVRAQGRILALDVMRGVVIAFMILVNNNGSEQAAYSQLRHSTWNGWTLTDLVFPSFLFMVGITSVLGGAGRNASRGVLLGRILKRAVLLFCFGLIVNGFPLFPLATWRIYGVLQRIALCYLVVGILYLYSRKVGTFAGVAASALISYYVLMRWVPVPGYGLPTRDVPLLDPNGNWVAYLDRILFPGRLYEKVRDPEGLISTVPAIATACLGVLTAFWLRTARPAGQKLAGLVAGAMCGLAVGELWNIWFPINKKLWTSSYVLFAGGCSLFLLAFCYLLLDVKKWQGWWTRPWVILGSNAITAYMFSELLAGLLHAIKVNCGGAAVSLSACIYQSLFSHIIDPSFGSLCYSLSFVAVCFVPNWVLFGKKVFLKL